MIGQHEVLQKEVDHAGVEVDVQRSLHDTLHVLLVGVKAFYVGIGVDLALEGGREELGEEESDDLAGKGNVGGTKSKDDEAFCLDVVYLIFVFEDNALHSR